MKNSIAVLGVIVTCLVLVYAGEEKAECTCAAAKLKGGWCTECKVGYLASVKIDSELLFETLDAHGHHIDPVALKCDFCKKAHKSGGYCEQCRMGWVDHMAYMSRLTYHIAKGKPVDASKLACKTCRPNSTKHGWCDSCQVGMIGNIVVDDRKDFVHAVTAYDRLLAAVKKLNKCEMCALATMFGTKCTKCGISYKQAPESTATETIPKYGQIDHKHDPTDHKHE